MPVLRAILVVREREVPGEMQVLQVRRVFVVQLGQEAIQVLQVHRVKPDQKVLKAPKEFRDLPDPWGQKGLQVRRVRREFKVLWVVEDRKALRAIKVMMDPLGRPDRLVIQVPPDRLASQVLLDQLAQLELVLMELKILIPQMPRDM